MLLKRGVSGRVNSVVRLFESRRGRNVTVLNSLTRLKHRIVESLLNLDLQVLVLERGCLMSVDTDSSEHASIVGHVVTILRLGGSEASHKALEA